MIEVKQLTESLNKKYSTNNSNRPKRKRKLTESIDQHTIDAVQWSFGFNKREAIDYIKNASDSLIKEIVATFEDNAKRSFLTDSLNNDIAWLVVYDIDQGDIENGPPINGVTFEQVIVYAPTEEEAARKFEASMNTDDYYIRQAKQYEIDKLNGPDGKSMTEDLDWYFGKEEAEKYGDLVSKKLAGQTVSKRKDLAEEPGGLIYEANRLGIDIWDLLATLEGLCYANRAVEFNDSTYFVGSYDEYKMSLGESYKLTEESEPRHWSHMLMNIIEDEAIDPKKMCEIFINWLSDEEIHRIMVEYDLDSIYDEEIIEIPGFEGMLDQLDKLKIR